MYNVDLLNRVSFIMDLCNLKAADISFLTGVDISRVTTALCGVQGISDETTYKYIEGLHIKKAWLEEEDYKNSSLEDIFEDGWVIRHSEEEIGLRLATLDVYMLPLAGMNEISIPAAKRLASVCGKSAEWILYGIGKDRKDYPMDDIVLRYLYENPEERERIWKASREIRDGGTLASRMRAVMDYRGSNITAVSRLVFTSVPVIYAYLKGEKTPDRIWIEEFAFYLGVDADWLENGGEVVLKKPVIDPLWSMETARKEFNALVKRLHISQKKMAEELGYSRASLSKIGLGTYDITPELVSKIREVYDPQFLLVRPGEK